MIPCDKCDKYDNCRRVSNCRIMSAELKRVTSGRKKGKLKIKYASSLDMDEHIMWKNIIYGAYDGD